MSYVGEDSDNEMEGLNDRPPSSYGSMISDEQEDSDDGDDSQRPAFIVNQGPSGVTLHRPESPETAITERTNTHQSSIHREGAFLSHVNSRHETYPTQHRFSVDREPTITQQHEVQSDIRTERNQEDVQSVRQTEFSETQAEEEPIDGGAMEVQEETTETEMRDDYDEIVLDLGYTEPKDPLPPPPEGAGLKFQHMHPSLTLRHILTAMVESLKELRPAELAYFKRNLCSHYRFEYEYSTIADITDALDLADKMIELCGQGEALYLAIRSLQGIKQDKLAERLKKTCRRALLQHELKSTHDRRYYALYEGCCRPGQQRYIGDVYVEPLTVIRGSGTGDPVNTEHEVRRVPVTSQETVIRIGDIFRPLPNDPADIRTVMMTGVPASGLTVVVNKFLIDWKDGTSNSDFQFVFPLAGKELHLGKDGDQSFLQMLQTFFVEADNIRLLDKADCLALFIIDALDLCQYPLNFQTNVTVTSVTDKAPVDALLTSLIKGTLLPHSRVWITSHRTASHKVPAQFISRFVELRGFTDEKKKLYFTKRYKDQQLGEAILKHMKSSRTLDIMCHLPIFSWMVAYLFERASRKPDFGTRAPGITTFYSQFVIVQMNRSNERYRGASLEMQRWKEEDKAFVEKMAKLSFRMLMDNQDEFTVDDLFSLDLKYEDLRVRDEMFTEVRRTSDDQKTWVFKFVHFTVQEYMAAMYAYVTFRKHGKNVLESNKNFLTKVLSKDRPMIELYRPVIDRALTYPNGQLDLFLRFLVGLVTPGTEEHLRGYLLQHSHPKPKGPEEVGKYISKKIKENINPERCRNLELCLVELEEGKKDK